MSTSDARVRIGFVGTGIMGKPMASNLLRAGFPVAVYNRTASRVADLLVAGATAPGSPRAVAEVSDVVITMLPGWPEVEAVLHGHDGLLAGMRPGSTYVGMETLAPEQSQTIAKLMSERGIAALDAPVSGGEKGATEATLAIMVGGPQETFEAVLPILRAMGSNVTRIGDAGAGQIAKACNQLIVAVTIEAVAEAMALARAFGVDQRLIRQALMGGFATSRILELHGQRMIDGDYTPGGAMKAHMKDREIVAETCRSAGLELPAARLAFDRMKEMVDRGDGDLDHSALYLLLARATGRDGSTIHSLQEPG